MTSQPSGRGLRPQYQSLSISTLLDSTIQYTKFTVQPTDVEQIFIDVATYIQRLRKGEERDGNWNVYVRFSKSKMSSDTMAQLLNILIPEGKFRFFGNVPPIQPYVTFSDGFIDQKCRISVIKGAIKPSSSIGVMYYSTSDIPGVNDKNAWFEMKKYNTSRGDQVYSFIISSSEIEISKSVKDTHTTNVSTMLTRPDIFPPGPPLYRISFTSQAQYSVTPMATNKLMVDDILKYCKDHNIIKVAMLDGTANVGSDTINTAVTLLSRQVKFTLFAIEIDPVNYAALVDNIHLYNLEGNVNMMLGDTVEQLQLQSKKTKWDSGWDNNLNIMYFDPPWGGKDYKTNQNVKLFLGKDEIFGLSLHIANDPYKRYSQLKLIVIKAPYNFDKINPNLVHFGTFAKVVSYNVPSARNIVYIYIDVNGYRSKKHNSSRQKSLTINVPSSPVYQPSSPLIIKETTLDAYLDINSAITPPTSPTYARYKGMHKHDTIDDYDSYYMNDTFYSVYPGWVQLCFIPGAYPLFKQIGSLSIVKKGSRRLYIFPQKEHYHAASILLYRLIWLAQEYEGNLMFMTKLSLDANLNRLPSIILDIRIEPGDMKILTKKLINASGISQVNSSLYDLLTPPPNMTSFNITTRLHFLQVVDSRNNSKPYISIASTTPFLVMPTCGEPTTPVNLPPDITIASFMNRRKIDLLGPYRLEQILKD